MSLEWADWILCELVLVPCGVEQAVINRADRAIREAWVLNRRRKGIFLPLLWVVF